MTTVIVAFLKATMQLLSPVGTLLGVVWMPSEVVMRRLWGRDDGHWSRRMMVMEVVRSRRRMSRMKESRVWDWQKLKRGMARLEQSRIGGWKQLHGTIGTISK